VNHLGHHSFDSHRMVNFQHQFYGLDDQIKHKIQVVEKIIDENPDARLIFAGHSIGAYMIMRMLIERPDFKSKAIFHLFPTLHSLKVAPFVQILSVPLIRDIICPVLAYVPDFMKQYILNLSGTSRDEALLANAPSYFHSSTLRNIFYLVRDEVNTLQSIRPEEIKFLSEYSKQSKFFFTRYDPYVPLEMVQDYRTMFPDSEIYKFEDKDKVKHAFVLSGVENVIEKMAFFLNGNKN
jgi:hypothetical protein